MSAEVFRFTTTKVKKNNTKCIKKIQQEQKNQLEANINSHSLCSFKKCQETRQNN